MLPCIFLIRPSFFFHFLFDFFLEAKFPTLEMEIELETKGKFQRARSVESNTNRKRGICTGSSNPLNAIVRGKRGEAAARNLFNLYLNGSQLYHGCDQWLRWTEDAIGGQNGVMTRVTILERSVALITWSIVTEIATSACYRVFFFPLSSHAYTFLFSDVHTERNGIVYFSLWRRDTRDRGELTIEDSLEFVERKILFWNVKILLDRFDENYSG